MTASLIDTAISKKYIQYIDPDKVKIDEKLWDGAFSEVYQAKWGNRHSSVTVIAKILRTFQEDTVDEETREEFIKELKQLRNVERHPSILNFWGISKDLNAKNYILVMEYADCGQLRSYLAKNFTELTDEHKLQLAVELASGVEYLHNEDIVHGDLNSTTILVHQNHIKIGDLGLSKRINMEIAHSSSILRAQLQYIDPQYYINSKYTRDKRSDIYSIGVLFWELTSGRVAFEKLREAIVAAVINGKREEPIEGTPQPFIDLYTRCWDQNPARRPKIDEVCKTLDGIDWSSETYSIYSELSDDTETVVGETAQRENDEDTELLDGATQILRESLDSGEDLITIGTTQIAKYLEEKNQGENGLANMLVSENVLDKNVIDSPYALLLGFSYYEGIGLEANHELAFKAFQAAAKKGDSHAEYLLAHCYQKGYGTKLNKTAAFKWYKKSAEKENPRGQYGLANCFRDGDGISKDPNQAFEWYKKSAEGGSRLGEFHLANAYRTGSGTRKDDEEAKRWYQMSVDHGYWEAGNHLERFFGISSSGI